MKLQAFLFVLYIFIVSDMWASFQGAWNVFRMNGNPTMRFLGIMLLSLFLESCGLFIANAFGYVQKPEFTGGYAWSFWIGKVCRSIGVWMFVLHITGWRGKKK